MSKDHALVELPPAQYLGSHQHFKVDFEDLVCFTCGSAINDFVLILNKHKVLEIKNVIEVFDLHKDERSYCSENVLTLCM